MDVFGAPNASAVTVAPFSFGTTGVLTINSAPFVVPCVLAGTPSQILRISSQYSSISFDINGASVLDLSATGVHTGATVRFDGTFGVGGNIAPNTRFKVDLGGVGQEAFTSAATSTNSGGYANVRPSSIANTSGTGDLFILGAGTASLNPTGASTNGAALYVDAPNKGGAGTFSNLSAAYISGTPTGGTNNYSLWVAGTLSRFDSAVAFSSPGTALTNQAKSLYSSSSGLLSINSGATAIQLVNAAGTTERMRVTDAGIVLVGTTVAIGASAGNIVVPNAVNYKGVNAAGTTTIPAIGIDSSDRVALAPGGANTTVGGHLLASSDGGSDLGAAGATRFRDVFLTSSVAVGNNAAGTGVIRLANTGQINARNQGNSADIALINLNTSNQVELGQTAAVVVPAADASLAFGTAAKRWDTGLFASSVSVGATIATTGVLRVANTGSIYSRNQANTSDILMIGTDSTNMILVGTGSTNVIRMGGKVRCDLDTLSRFVLPVGTNKYAV